MLYIFNTLVTPVNFDKYTTANITLRKISIEEAKELLNKNQFTSAIGHEGTAKVLSQLLGVNIPTNRISVYMEPGDIGIHFFLKQRLPEGKVLSEEELRKLDFWLVQSSVSCWNDEEEEKKFVESIKEIFGEC
jgi:hypothetical protein